MEQSSFSNLTKGRTLEQLSKSLVEAKFKVPPLYILEVKRWLDHQELVHSEIYDMFGDQLVVVRSSASDEDGVTSAKAGEYDSVLEINVRDLDALNDAINVVIRSYEKAGISSVNQEILIQKMVQNTTCSGVVFTHDLNTGAPYYVVNYDDATGTTNTVTSGAGEYSNRTLYVHRSSAERLRSDRFKSLITAVQELEKILESDLLDIEFAIDQKLNVFLLQTRKITTQNKWGKEVVSLIDRELKSTNDFVGNKFKPIPNVFGKTTVFGQMPDWNPAEMIGRAPRALSISLYRCLITDNAWRIARAKMGYAVPSEQPLMVLLSGQPFIDTRLSFHSYLPQGLSTPISEKLVDEWVDRLKSKPELHDKIEFDVAITTYDFDLNKKMSELASSLDSGEREKFKKELFHLTHPFLMGDGKSSIAQALKSIKQLAQSNLSRFPNSPAGIQSLIDDCFSLGTIPFAILARHGFIARSLLLSLVSRGVLSQEDINHVLGGIHTVAGDLLNDIQRYRVGNLSHSVFMQKYGHLRPGTYDILSKRYDQMDSFCDSTEETFRDNQITIPYELSSKQKKDIDSLLKESGFSKVNHQVLMKYIYDAVAGREYGKFIFTRSVSAILECIAEFGSQHNISREEMSHVPVGEIIQIGLNGRKDPSAIMSMLKEIADANRSHHVVCSAIRLPQILSDSSGVRIIPFQVSHPNFITSKKISAESLFLGPHDASIELKGKIVLIENADPGYDWIFAQKIKGLVTKYGGANSHMAIRCAEFSIPAAIGCGEQRFDLLVKSSKLSLDCAVGLVHPIH